METLACVLLCIVTAAPTPGRIEKAGPGATRDEVLEALGTPEKAFSFGGVETLYYEGLLVILRDGKVTEHKPRKLSKERETLKERAARRRRERDQKRAIKEAAKGGFRLEGRVVSVFEEGILLHGYNLDEREAYLKKIGGVYRGKRPPSILTASSLAFVLLADTTGLADGQAWVGKVYAAGIQSFATAIGATKTVPRFATVARAAARVLHPELFGETLPADFGGARPGDQVY